MAKRTAGPEFDERLIAAEGPLLVSAAPEGVDAWALSEIARGRHAAQDGISRLVVHVARDDRRLAAVRSALGFFAPDLRILSFPAWDCVPYDRVAPNREISARRIATLTRLAGLAASGPKRPTVVLTTINALLQRVPPASFFRASARVLAPGDRVDLDALAVDLENLGFTRTGTVMEAGEFAVRGGIVDVFPPGRPWPVRLDLFGDELEKLRAFDAETQRTKGVISRLAILPASEVPSSPEALRLFRQSYVRLFGTVTGSDPLYEAVSSGARYQGVEHWLPLFFDELVTLFDYAPGALIALDGLVEDARARRHEQISDHYESRVASLEQRAFGAPPYHPVPPNMMFLDETNWLNGLTERPVRYFTPFEVPEGGAPHPVVSFGGRQARSFAPERADESVNVFEAAAEHLRSLREGGRRTLVACWTRGAQERLVSLLGEHGLDSVAKVDHWSDAQKLSPSVTGVAVLPLEAGFDTASLAVLGEQDILGDRLVRPRRKGRSASDVLTEVESLSVGDLVVHADHGIGRFCGLKTIEAAGAPHDCLELLYHGGDKLYLPVENIELLTRYGSEEGAATLDRLGGSGWQARKARIKQRIRDIAAALIKVAAARELRTAEAMPLPDGLYEEFAARFPYDATDDQQASIEAVEADLASGKPMDRLVCGDVGFGKTEVALRSAFISVMNGKQVAVVVPTTLLARQHYQTFIERFRGLPVRIAQASRLVGTRELAEVKQGLAKGDIDIVIGTHALLGKTISFADLGLLIVDEEQHFGVVHKERLKQMRSEVHVLTLTATPIPRTLQLALSGVRELSLIATPPVDRLAVRTFVTPFDPVIVRDALLRERFRGGQSFYVCPRITDLEPAGAFLDEHVPELKVARAHGQMPARQLEDVMNAFYDRAYDVLLSTTIIESGLDIPTANTLIVHRSDMFGLAQLYQLRGRVGRSKTRAYALFTVQPDANLTPAAEKRLKVLQSLDTLGAGFTLASHDLDIRGAGNLLGEEQSGHIREVGFELYQSMLEEAVAAQKGGDGSELEDQWSPRISIGAAVLIPEAYVPDLQVRLGLYRRLSTIWTETDIEGFAAELTDRFGPLPEEVQHLLKVVRIKALCRQAEVDHIEAGPKGAKLGFRNNRFANADALIAKVTQEPGKLRLQPDQHLILRGDWPEPDDRIRGCMGFLQMLADMAEDGRAAA